jgi:hypothetical protein
MPGYSNKAKYQTKPTEEISTTEERFVVDKPVEFGLDSLYKVIVIAMLAYIIAKVNKLV